MEYCITDYDSFAEQVNADIVTWSNNNPQKITDAYLARGKKSFSKQEIAELYWEEKLS